ncbi:cadherin repeat domain-containing protein [Methylocucumis oryzae]|uniref:Cadherin domain-containing protein n=1 Tax=Methylocucumis oryzae TaxID=1632867 RepID=A0A0F3IIQ1_9GAMM|nr:cadherin repeat domain-containing protein [Methylocucumis oryzae]KJV06591.1 hypothetical protein VZ94_10350 [Methylocucumis oryzae]
MKNVSALTVIGNLSSTDPDSGNSFTYSLVGGSGAADNSAFSISGNQLLINNSPNFENQASYSVRIRTTDQGGLFFDKVFSVNVNNVNETPTNIALSANTVNENVSALTVVGNLSSTDPDSGNSFTYSLVSGSGATDNSAFSISGNQLLINNSPNFENQASYSILIRTTDQGGLFFDKVFSVNVNNVNETPTDIALSANTVNENVPANTIIGNLSSTDPDSGNSFSYSLVGGSGATDNALFTISGNQLLLNNSPNFENQASYNIRIRTTDQGGLFFDKVFSVNVNNVNETPSNIALSANTVNENVSALTVVSNLSSTDPDTGNSFTYSLVSGNGATDNALFTISGNQLLINNSPNFENQASYNIRIRTTDQGGLFFDKVFFG